MEDHLLLAFTINSLFMQIHTGARTHARTHFVALYVQLICSCLVQNFSDLNLTSSCNFNEIFWNVFLDNYFCKLLRYFNYDQFKLNV